MRKISLAKTIILLFLIPFCIYLLYKIHSSWTSRDFQEHRESQQEKAEIARVEQFEMKGLEMDGEAFTLKANKFSQLEKGAFLLEQIDPFTLFTSEGQKIILSGDRGVMVEGKEEHKKIVIEGNVAIRTEDGQELKTEKLTYETTSKEAHSDSEVTFSGPGFHGKASRMHYFLDTETVELAPHFELWLQRKAGEIHIQAAYFEGSLNLKRGLLKDGVAIHDKEQEILAQEAKLIADPKTGQWEKIQLSGSVRGKSFQGEGDQKTLVRFLAQRLDIFFDDEENPDKIIMEEDVSVSVEDKNESSGSYKEIKCEQLISYWNEGAVAQIEAEGSVRVEMRHSDIHESASQETLSCHALFISFDQNGAVSQALAIQDVEFQSGTTRGTCQEAEYVPEKKQIIMREKENQPPYLNVDAWSVYAKEIIVKGRDEISALKAVKTLYQEKKCKQCQIPLFQSDKSIFISSDKLDIIKGEEAVYSGHVRAWQEENSIEAQNIHIFFKDNIFKAQGDVISRFSRPLSQDSNEGKESADSSQERYQRIEVQSDHLIYSGDQRKATYKDHVSLHMKESKMSCSEMDVLFSEKGQAEEIKARSGIEIESKDFEGEGDLLEYFLSERAGKLSGTIIPARVYSKSGKEIAVSASLTFHMAEDTISLLSRDEGRTWMIFK